jgi:carboxylate-amine ligase
MTLSLFSAYGIELEYMIVDKKTLNVKPAADKLLKLATGEDVNEAEFDTIGWSNELALHIIEMKTNGPRVKLNNLATEFHQNVQNINQFLASVDACLLPTGAHPWMDPHRESFLWPHEQNEIYHAFNRIFDCKGHGWTNLQSMHLNLPFANDKEFALLHSAIRLLLPLMPALSASTPIIDAKKTGYMDTRLRYYQFNQKNIPIIAGSIIPELIFSEEEYQEKILNEIYKAIAPHDPDGILQDEWLNSRGAIPKFQYKALEIRILDTQECPAADIAIADAITETLRFLTDKIDLRQQDKWSCERLLGIFNQVIQHGLETMIDDQEYLALFGMQAERASVKAIWQHIFMNVIQLTEETESIMRIILQHGNLAQRILFSVGDDLSPSHLRKVYQQLALCLQEQRLYQPDENYYHL